MTTTFPTTLDSLTNPAPTDPTNAPSHADQHEDANDAVEALEAKVGVDASTVTTSLDYALRVHHYPLEVKPGSADTPDDDFPTGTLDGKWTVVDGTEAAVDLLQTSNVERYDPDTRPSWLLMQAGPTAGSTVQLRQDYTLPDGNSIIAKLSPTITTDAGISNNEYWVGLGLNDNDSTWDAGEDDALIMDTETTGVRFVHIHTTTVGTTTTTVAASSGTTAAWPLSVYLRFHRSGSSVISFLSMNGVTWTPMFTRTRSATATNVWLFAACLVTGSTPVPVHAFDWVRLGSSSVKPW